MKNAGVSDSKTVAIRALLKQHGGKITFTEASFWLEAGHAITATQFNLVKHLWTRTLATAK